MAYTLIDLQYLMQRLRCPESGCPWDAAQNFRTIAPSTIEKAYEVVDAIERDDMPSIKEELGDLLFQVIFYAQLAKEQQAFTLDDVIDGLTQKLIRRHPHVFPGGSLTSHRDISTGVLDVKGQWESIKASERKEKGLLNYLDDIPAGLPAIARALKLQKRAAAGAQFDWLSADQVFIKLQEEIAELRCALADGENNHSQVEDELGDVLFTVINLARHIRVEPETALRRSNNKFTARFNKMASLASAQGVNLEQLSDCELDELWRTAKKALSPSDE